MRALRACVHASATNQHVHRDTSHAIRWGMRARGWFGPPGSDVGGELNACVCCSGSEMHFVLRVGSRHARSTTTTTTTTTTVTDACMCVCLNCCVVGRGSVALALHNSASSARLWGTSRNVATATATSARAASTAASGAGATSAPRASLASACGGRGGGFGLRPGRRVGGWAGGPAGRRAGGRVGGWTGGSGPIAGLCVVLVALRLRVSSWSLQS